MAPQAVPTQQPSAEASKRDQKKAVRAVVIVKRRKGGHEDAHHGGQWKVAYADFVTAMMAFFLLLWLLNSTTQEQKMGISNYFAPEATSYSRSGSGGVLSGRTLNSKGPMTSPTSPMGLVIHISRPENTEGEKREGTALRRKRHAVESRDGKPGLRGQNEPEGQGKREGTGPGQRAIGKGTGAGQRKPGQGPGTAPDDPGTGAARREERRFKQAEKAILIAIQRSPELRKLADSIVINRTVQGLHIQLIDRDKVSMFAPGSAVLEPHTRKLLARIVDVVRHLPNKVAIAGHTDAKPYAKPKGYGNWELSADQANASRRALVELGLPAARISRVAGKADRDPLITSNPEDPRNRRISLLLLREAPAPKDYSDNTP